MTNASDMKQKLLVICNICKWQGLFNRVSQTTDGDIQGKELRVFNTLQNESEAPVYWLANIQANY